MSRANTLDEVIGLPNGGIGLRREKASHYRYAL